MSEALDDAYVEETQLHNEREATNAREEAIYLSRLRDQFMMAALTGFLSSGTFKNDDNYKKVAEYCRGYADACMAERKK